MKQQLFGLRKAYINKLIKQIKFDFSLQNSNLMMELERLRAENSQLEKEISEKTKEIDKQNNNIEIWNLGQERIEDVVQYLEEKQIYEMGIIQDNFTDKVSKINKQLGDLESEIQTKVLNFSNLLDQFAKEIESSKELKPIQEVNSNSQAKQKAIINKKTLNINRVPTQLPVISEVAASTESVEDDTNYHLTPLKEELKEEDLEEMADSSEKHSNSDNFWGDIEDLTKKSFTIFETQLSGSHEYEYIDEEFSNKAIKKEDTQFNLKNSEKTSEAASVDYKNSEIPNNQFEVHSESLLAQIDSIKTQYIVGKVAGEDIHDLHGNMIVARNSLITREAVERINRIGKLAELIVNMKLTGEGED